MKIYSADPIQPFWVVNSARYYKKISKVPAIAHFYKFHGASGIASSYAVPDGAIDIIIECGSDRLNARICGPVSQGSLCGFEEDRTYFGIRMRTESLDHLGEASISDLVGHEYALDDLVHSRGFLEQISEEKDFIRQAAIFEKKFLESSSSTAADDTVHRLAGAVLSEIYKSNGMIRVSDLESKLHYSRRHLTRCFSCVMGMDIKTFSKYVRFQHILHGIRDGAFETAADAAMAGSYYDQSHFQKDFRTFTHTTPRRMMKLFRDSDYSSRIVLVSGTYLVRT